MRGFYFSFFFGLISLLSFSQQIVVTPLKGVDTLFLSHIKPIEIRKSYPKAKFTSVDSLLFKLDSLARPFYQISHDTILNEITYNTKYRLNIKELSGDTTYIPIPKKETFIIAKRQLDFEPIKIDELIKVVEIDTTKVAPEPVWWSYRNNFAFDISEAAFVNWNAGGNNSVSGLVKVSFYRDYKKAYVLWKNEILARYGLNAQEDRELRKTDDKLLINSTFGYRTDTISNWYYSIKFNFNTQFTDGYSYPDTNTPISRFFAPAYLFLGAGAQYDLKKDQFYVYLSPITLKSTFVRDKRLSDEGAFGVEQGKRSRNEFGFLVQGSWDVELLKNVIMKNDISLYSDYLRNFGNIDVKYDLALNFIINKYMRANLGAHLIYDNDIKFKEDVDNDGTLDVLGPRLQLKQLLGIGVAFTF